MTTTLIRPVTEPVPSPTSRRRIRARLPWSTPRRLRVQAVVVLGLVLALATLLSVEASRQQDGLDVIGRVAEPTVVAASDLYLALNDMDAQLANVLMVGDERGLGFTRQQALDLYEQRRHQADQDLQRVAAIAGDPGTVRNLLDGLGRYEALAARTILLDEQAHHLAGQPPAGALDSYRQAVDLLKAEVLPAAQSLTDRYAKDLEDAYQQRHGEALLVGTLAGGLGLVLLGALALVQYSLLRRFRRLVNPLLLLGTVLALVLTVSGAIVLRLAAEDLRVAKKDAFDSLLVLNQARAVSYDANADESRYLVDPARASQYQQAFLAKSQRLVALDGARLDSYDGALDDALRAYQGDHTDIRWYGFFGTEFRNITFTGERTAAEDTLLAYQTYQRDDRRIRQLNGSGRLRAAIAFCTSFAPGDSNYAFDRYDKALSKLTDINQHAFDEAIGSGTSRLAGWTPRTLGDRAGRRGTHDSRTAPAPRRIPLTQAGTAVDGRVIVNRRALFRSCWPWQARSSLPSRRLPQPVPAGGPSESTAPKESTGRPTP
jgi:hypothetical protein